MAVTVRGDIDLPTASTHEPHPLHRVDRVWPETNCYLDLWLETLHALGLEPRAALAFLIGDGFDGEQWTFFKYPPEDLRRMYGIEVAEINVWRTVEVHVLDHFALGHLLTVECDAVYLPDTAGVAHGIAHQKTTIAPIRLDPDARVLTYFHNSGCYELDGDNYDGVLRSGSAWSPYMECIDLDGIVRHDDHALRSISADLFADHLARRRPGNAVQRMADRVISDVPWLRSEPVETFHRYAFGTLRQCGAWAELLADFLVWLGGGDLVKSGNAFRALAAAAKTVQFTLARAAHGREVDLRPAFDTMSALWEQGYGALAA